MKKITDTLLEKELDLYKKYYEVDEENKLIRFVLHYETASELIESKLTQSKEKPIIKYEVLSDISSMIRSLPETYRADVTLDIKNLEGYKSELLMEAIKDSIEFSRFRSEKKVKKNWVLASMFTLIGLIILLVSAFITSFAGEWSNTTNGNIVKEILDIAAWVFIWEAVSILFISSTEESLVENSLRIKLHSLAISTPKNESESSFEEDASYLLSEHRFDRVKIKKTGKYLLLVSGFLMIASGIATVFLYLSGMKPVFESIFTGGINGTTVIGDTTVSNQYLIAAIIIMLLLEFLILGIRILGGVAAVSRFTGKGKLQKFVGPYAIGMLVFYMAIFIIASVNRDLLQSTYIGAFLSSVFGIVLNVTYLVGYSMDRIGK